MPSGVSHTRDSGSPFSSLRASSSQSPKRRLVTHAQRLRLVREPGEVQLAWRSSWAARASSSAWRAAATPARPTRRVRASSCQSPQFTARRAAVAVPAFGVLAALAPFVVRGTLQGGLSRGPSRSFDEAELRGHNRSITEGYDIYSCFVAPRAGYRLRPFARSNARSSPQTVLDGSPVRDATGRSLVD